MKAFCERDRLGVVLKETGKVIGMISLAEDERAVKCYELGFIYEGIEHKAMEHDELGAVDLICYYIER